MKTIKREMWKPVDGFPRYEVSNTGRVRSLKGFYPSPHMGSGGLVVALRGPDRIGTSARVARLVGKAFQPSFHPELFPVYRDGDRTNCAASNLRWVTRSRITGSPYSKNPKTMKKQILILATAACLSTTSCVTYKSSDGAMLASVGGKVALENGAFASNHEASFAVLGSVAKHGIWGTAIKSAVGTVGSVMNTESGNDVLTNASNNGVSKVASDNGVLINASNNATKLGINESNNALKALKDTNATGVLLQPVAQP